VLAGEPNGQIVLVLRPTSAVPDRNANGATVPNSIEGLTAETLGFGLNSGQASRKRKAALDLPPPKESKAAYSSYVFPARAQH
jgi:hypothetical protein